MEILSYTTYSRTLLALHLPRDVAKDVGKTKKAFKEYPYKLCIQRFTVRQSGRAYEACQRN